MSSPSEALIDSNSEVQRVNALVRYGILDTLPEHAFDRLTFLASKLFSAPIALVSLVDRDRVFLKSCYGLSTRQVKRQHAFSSYTILGNEVMVVPDASLDPRFAEAPLVAGRAHLRFYAGAPLETPLGTTIGALCVLDKVPRESFDDDQQRLLAELADMVVEALEHHRLAKEREHERAFLQTVLDNVTDGIVACDAEGRLTLFNQAARELHGLSEQTVAAEAWAEYYSLFEADGVSPLATDNIPLRRAYAGETVKNVELVVRPAGQSVRQLSASGQAFSDVQGKVAGAVVAMRDVTAERKAEEALSRSEAHYRTIISTLHEGVVQQDAQGRITDCNAAAERILGLSKDQLRGRVATDPRWHIVAEDGSVMLASAQPPVTVLRTGLPVHDVVIGVHREDGELTWLLANAKPLFQGGQQEPYAVVSSFTDITKLKRIEAQLRHLSLHDTLTGLPTRTLLSDQLERAFARAERAGKYDFALLYLDLDGFKTVNDTLGHAAGDYVLAAVARRLQACVRKGDTVARLGGDEFVLLAEGIMLPSEAVRLAERIVSELTLTVAEGRSPLVVRTSVGIALAAPGLGAAALIAQADQAMYRAKHEGKARYALASSASTTSFTLPEL